MQLLAQEHLQRKPISPVLLMPSNFAKSISKDSIKDILILQNIDIAENLPKTLPLFCIRINKLRFKGYY
jgi:hypothetical protein